MASRAKRQHYLLTTYPALAPTLASLRQVSAPKAGEPQLAEQMVLIERQESEGQRPWINARKRK